MNEISWHRPVSSIIHCFSYLRVTCRYRLSFFVIMWACFKYPAILTVPLCSGSGCSNFGWSNTSTAVLLDISPLCVCVCTADLVLSCFRRWTRSTGTRSSLPGSTATPATPSRSSGSRYTTTRIAQVPGDVVHKSSSRLSWPNIFFFFSYSPPRLGF